MAQNVTALADRAVSLVADLAALLADLGVFLAVFAAVYLAGRFVVVPLAERVIDAERVAHRVQESVARAGLKLVRAAVVLGALTFGLRASGFGRVLDIPPTVIAALTVAIGFASRDVASNLVGGVFVVLDPAFEIGDWIRWRDREGVIEDVGFRATRVRTFDNELLTVPNSELATSAVTNAVARSPRRVSLTVHVRADENLAEVASILVTEARVDDDILDVPTPTARVVALDDSRAAVETRFWIDQPSREVFVAIRSSYLERVSQRFAEAGIELPPRW